MKSYEVGSLAPEHLPTCNLFLMSKSVHNKIPPLPPPSAFAYCKRSKTGGVKGRLPIIFTQTLQARRNIQPDIHETTHQTS